MKNIFKGTKDAARNRAKRRGQTLVEYALIIAVIAIVAIGVLATIGHQTQGMFTLMTCKMAQGQASSH